ncbi:hypothetical protein NXW27_18305 [Phocaeicola dorei]|nr:hypothetical protein [Phocaeicola dorei]
MSVCIEFFFAGYSDENTRWISPGDDDFTVQIVNGNIQPGQLDEDLLCS